MYEPQYIFLIRMQPVTNFGSSVLINKHEVQLLKLNYIVRKKPPFVITMEI